MTYFEALNYIMNIPRFAKINTMERMSLMLNALGNPERKLKFVHVAGTNGKGSTTAMLASVLKHAGYKTGCYISPFIEDFRERISINCDMIPESEFARLCKLVSDLTDTLPSRPNAFEIITVIALCYFAESKCDVAVLETGLGGRWDATNVIPAPVLAIITSISLDHTGILGDTCEKIAGEKCGILKSKSSAITCDGQPPEVLKVITKACGEVNIPLTIPDSNIVEIIKQSIYGTEIRYNGLNVFIPLAGKHQVQNTLAVIEAAHILNSRGYAITGSDILEGIGETRFPVRMEVISNNPLIVIDGAHNPAGIEALSLSVKRLMSEFKIVTIFGCLADKNAPEMIEKIASVSDFFIAVKPDSARACGLATMQEIANEFCLNTVCDLTLVNAIERAKQIAGNNGAILICGSLYLAGQARSILNGSIINVGVQRIGL